MVMPSEVHARSAFCQRGRVWAHDRGHTRGCAGERVCGAHHANGKFLPHADYLLADRADTGIYLAVWLWPEQLLPGRARAVRVHRGVRAGGDLHRVAQGA